MQWWWKQRARFSYWLARKLFNKRWAVENDRLWEWMQARFSRMAQFNDVEAQVFYGHLLLYKGQGQAARNEGLRLLRLAAQGGDAKAAYQLGMYHLDGRQKPAEPIPAAEWFELALQLGHPLAGTKLLQLYEESGPAETANADKAARLLEEMTGHFLHSELKNE